MNWTKQSDDSINLTKQGDSILNVIDIKSQVLIYTTAGEKLYTTAGVVIGISLADSVNTTAQGDGSVNFTKQNDGSINWTEG